MELAVSTFTTVVFKEGEIFMTREKSGLAIWKAGATGYSRLVKTDWKLNFAPTLDQPTGDFLGVIDLVPQPAFPAATDESAHNEKTILSLRHSGYSQTTKHMDRVPADVAGGVMENTV